MYYSRTYGSNSSALSIFCICQKFPKRAFFASGFFRNQIQPNLTAGVAGKCWSMRIRIHNTGIKAVNIWNDENAINTDGVKIDSCQ